MKLLEAAGAGEADLAKNTVLIVDVVRWVGSDRNRRICQTPLTRRELDRYPEQIILYFAGVGDGFCTHGPMIAN